MVKFNVFAAKMYPFLAAAIMGIVIYFLSPILVRSLISLNFMILLAQCYTFLCIFLFARNEVLADARLVISHLRRKMSKVSAVISAYNEEKNIEQCLKSLAFCRRNNSG